MEKLDMKLKVDIMSQTTIHYMNSSLYKQVVSPLIRKIFVICKKSVVAEVRVFTEM